MSLLTSPTDFRGIPMSRLLAALYGDMNATPSTQYATPVAHSTSSSFRKGVDPRNRPRPKAATKTAQVAQPVADPSGTSDTTTPVATRGLKGAALQNAYAQNRAAMRARRQQEAQDLEAPKATNRAKPKQAPAPKARPASESAIALAKALRNPDRSYDAAESARLAPRTMGAPSSVYAAPAATPVSNRYQEVEGMLGDMEARQAAQGLDARYREAAIQSKYGTDAEMLAERNRLAAEQEVLNRNADRAQMGVDLLHAQQNAARRAEAEAQYRAALAEPTDMQRLGGAVSRAFSPEGLSALYQVGADPISELYRKAFPRGPIFVR
jgi:hypothetical protein